MAVQPYYHTCARKTTLNDHECEANPRTGQKIEWEHAIIHAGRQLQEEWAIIPSCWWAHSGPGLVKEINVWLALNRATDDELKKISRAVDYQALKERLNKKYGAPGVPRRNTSS